MGHSTRWAPPMIILIIITAVGLCLCAGYGVNRWSKANRSVKQTGAAGATVDFTFITTGLGAPFSAAASPPPRRQASQSTGTSGFKIQQTTTNPDAYCLLTGTTVRDCSCAEHRSVK